MNNQFGIDYAFPGLCSLCHVEVAEFNGSHSNGRPRITKFKGNKREVEVVLDDQSKMTVVVCKDCYETFTPDKMDVLMDSEINGWQAEMNILDWDSKRKISHMNEYSKRRVISRTDKQWSHEEMGKLKKRKVRSRHGNNI